MRRDLLRSHPSPSRSCAQWHSAGKPSRVPSASVCSLHTPVRSHVLPSHRLPTVAPSHQSAAHHRAMRVVSCQPSRSCRAIAPPSPQSSRRHVVAPSHQPPSSAPSRHPPSAVSIAVSMPSAPINMTNNLRDTAGTQVGKAALSKALRCSLDWRAGLGCGSARCAPALPS